MFKKIKQLEQKVKSQQDTIAALVKVVNDLNDKVIKIDEEIHPKYFGGK